MIHRGDIVTVINTAKYGGTVKRHYIYVVAGVSQTDEPKCILHDGYDDKHVAVEMEDVRPMYTDHNPLSIKKAVFAHSVQIGDPVYIVTSNDKIEIWYVDRICPFGAIHTQVNNTPIVYNLSLRKDYSQMFVGFADIDRTFFINMDDAYALLMRRWEACQNQNQ